MKNFSEPEIAQEWTKVARPSKVIAKIVFSSSDELLSSRGEILKKASAACNILYFQVYPKSEPPSLTIHVETQHDLLSLRTALLEYSLLEVDKTPVDAEKKITVVSNSPKTTLDDVKNRLKEYGSLIYAASLNAPNSTRKFFSVAFEDAKVSDLLRKKGRLFIGQDLVMLESSGPPGPEVKGRSHVLKLSNLPLATTDWHLKDIMNELKVKHWRVAFSKNMKRMPICYVAFTSEEEILLARKVRLKLSGMELLWSLPDEKLCERCLSQEHEFKNCRRFLLSQSKPIPNRAPISLPNNQIRKGESYASIAGGNVVEHLNKLREQHSQIKQYNDLIEQELIRSKKLHELSLQSCTSPEPENPPAEIIPSRTGPPLQPISEDALVRLTALEEKLQKIEEVLGKRLQETEELSKSLIEQRSGAIEVKLEGIEKSIGLLAKAFEKEAISASPLRKRILRKC